MPQRPVDDNHALLIGNLMGLLLRLNSEGVPTKIEPITIEGNYSDTMKVSRDSGTYVITIKKEILA